MEEMDLVLFEERGYEVGPVMFEICAFRRSGLQRGFPKGALPLSRPNQRWR